MSDKNSTGFDIFLSHSSSDKEWVRQLSEALKELGLTAFLDERDIESPDNFVLTINDALRDSRFLVLVVTPSLLASQWVEQEWTAHMATHGPIGRIVPIMLEPAELPPLLKTSQQIDATHREVEQVAAAIFALVGCAATLKDGDTRRLFIGQELTFVLTQTDDQLHVTDPTGQSRKVPKPWTVDNRFRDAFLGFNRLTKRPLDSNDDRAELGTHARTLGELMFEVLFGSHECSQLLQQACLPGRPQALVTIRSEDDVLLSLPWELLWNGDRFLVRDAVLDIARSTPGEVGPQALLREPENYFKLVVNVSAPVGRGLDYEAESYRITRALSDRCEVVHTELGTVDDLIETVKKSSATGVHFSGHGSPGQLQFENDEGFEAPLAIGELMKRLRARLPNGELPPFFYLASCHGNEPSVPEEGQSGSESSVAILHRAGVPQIVSYYGQIADELSTRAEEALYAAIAEGQPTRYAVRQARRALAEPFWGPDQKHRPTAECKSKAEGQPAVSSPRESQAAVVTTHPFSWAQLVFYHRGPDHPLSLPVPPDETRRVEQQLRRTFEGLGDRKRLSTGFIGRRSELHRIRRRLREGDRVLVFQGLGGVGKSTLALHTLPLLAAEENVCNLWCQETEGANNPAEQLVSQLLAHCRQRFGARWEGVVQQVDRAAHEDAALRFAYFLQALLQNVSRLALYLDNMESLLVGPEAVSDTAEASREGESKNSGEFAAWRSDQLARIWESLATAARDTGKLHLVASCRFRHEAFNRHTIPVSPLPADASYRLMGWFPGLRRLSTHSRGRLVSLLDGHPRAVEFANDLIQDALHRWQEAHGEEWPVIQHGDEDGAEKEWRELVEPALPEVRDRLWENLLLGAIWDRVLDEPARRMLYRMTLLLRPWDAELMKQLGEEDQPLSMAEATAERLRNTSLVEEVEQVRQIAVGQFDTVRRYTLHPATSHFITSCFADDPELRHTAHRRLGGHFEARTKESHYVDTFLDAGHHLFEAGEFNRSLGILVFASESLRMLGRRREALQILQPFLTESVLTAIDRQLVGRLLGTVGVAYSAVGQLKEASMYHEQRLEIDREIGDRRGEAAALKNLGSYYTDLGQVERAISFFEQSLVIDREIRDRRGEGSALKNLGAALSRIGQMERAISYYEQALEIAREIGDRRSESDVLGRLGNAYVELKQVERAIGNFNRALEIAREIGDPNLEADALGHLSNLFGKLGQVESAIAFGEQSLTIAREIGNRHAEGTLLGNLGTAYLDLGQVERAISFLWQSLVIDREIGDRRGEGVNLSNLGRAYTQLGQIERAIGNLEQALEIGYEIKNPRLIESATQRLQQLRTKP